MDATATSTSSRPPEGDNKIAWYENLGAGAFGSQQVMSTSASKPLELETVDVDQDGNRTSSPPPSGDNKVAWYENLTGPSRPSR